ncbi:MAG: hypothetical protein ACTHU0_00125, partial [Kofleriaceae bacterium]
TLRAAGLSLADARALAASGGRVPLRAPIAGTVTSVAAVVGASAPSDAALVELASGGATRIEARLPRVLPEGARLDFLAVGSAPVEATLVSLAPVRDPDGTTRAWLELAAPAAPGTAGRLRARVAAGSAAVVPASAIGRDETGTFVWRRDTTARRAPVRVLATSGADALVDGIAVGDQVAAVASAIEAASEQANAAPSEPASGPANAAPSDPANAAPPAAPSGATSPGAAPGAPR